MLASTCTAVPQRIIWPQQASSNCHCLLVVLLQPALQLMVEEPAAAQQAKLGATALLKEQAGHCLLHVLPWLLIIVLPDQPVRPQYNCGLAAIQQAPMHCANMLVRHIGVRHCLAVAQDHCQLTEASRHDLLCELHQLLLLCTLGGAEKQNAELMLFDMLHAPPAFVVNFSSWRFTRLFWLRYIFIIMASFIDVLYRCPL